MPRKQNASQVNLGQFTIIHRQRWQERTYTRLTWDEKMMLNQLETFDGISAAGVVRADPEILAQQHPDRSADQIRQYLEGLINKGWLDHSGSEFFVRNWFSRQPSQLRKETGVKSMAFAIRRIGYDDLRKLVTTALFDALLEIEDLDRLATTQAIKNVCVDLASDVDVRLPSLGTNQGGKIRRIS